jgi:hypothetical protein
MAIEYVTYIGHETHINPFSYRGQLGDTEVLIEVVWKTNRRVVLRLVSEHKRIVGIGISPSAL